MPLFPQLAPQYYDEKDRGILMRMEAAYAEQITLNMSYWSEGYIDYRFLASDQTLYSDLYGNLPVNRRRNFSFNHIKRIINMISGYQKRNRKSTVCIPIENGDDMTADQFTKILLWINQQEGVLETISDAFEGSLVTGMNLLQVWMDYRSDPISGNIKVQNCSYNSFLIDPFFRKRDLSDCASLWKRSFLTKRECLSLLPDSTEAIMGLSGSESGNGRDGKFQFMPESYSYAMKNLLTYDEFYYRDFRLQKMLADTQTGETMEWRSSDESVLREYLRRYPTVTVIEAEVPTVTMAIVVQGKVLYHGPQPTGLDCYPFVPVFAYYYPDLTDFPYRIQGVVRGLRDSQFLYNRRKVIELEIFESQINSGFKYKENALVNPKDIFLQGQGRGLALKEEAQMTDVEQIRAPDIPQSMLQVSDILQKEILTISGANEELMGSAVDDKAGILSMLRQGAGLTTLQGLFDNLDYAQKLLGSIMLQLIQMNFAPGKIKKILETQPSEQFYNKAFGRYDSAIEEGLNTTTQKQMQFAQLLKLRETGIPIPDDILIESSTLQNKKQLLDALAKTAQMQQQLQQQQTQQLMEEQKAKIDLVKASAQAELGLGAERLSKVEDNRAQAIERKSEAKKQEDIGLLNLVKALKEIDGVDLQQLEKLIQLSRVDVSNPVETEQTPIPKRRFKKKVLP